MFRNIVTFIDMMQTEKNMFKTKLDKSQQLKPSLLSLKKLRVLYILRIAGCVGGYSDGGQTWSSGHNTNVSVFQAVSSRVIFNIYKGLTFDCQPLCSRETVLPI